MNVLQLISSGGYYGAENVVVSLSESLERRNCRSVIGLFRHEHNPNEETAHQAQKRGLTVRQILCRGRWDWRTIREIRENLEFLNIDVLHTHGYKADVYGFLAARRLEIPVVSTCHGWTHDTIAVRVYELLDSLFLRNFDAVVVVSDAIAESLSPYGIHESKIQVIDNGIDLHSFIGTRATLAGKINMGQCFVVGTVGRLVPEKGLEYFLRAAREVLPDFPNVIFVFVGAGPDRERLERMAADLAVDRHVRFIGQCTDMPGAYASMDIFVLPSTGEGMPMAVLEALASKKPVVATRVGAVPKLIIPEKTGLLVAPRDVGALKLSILRLLKDPALRSRLGNAGEALVRRSHSQDIMAENYLRLYEQVKDVRTKFRLRTPVPEATEPPCKPVPVLLTVRELDHGGLERDVTKIALTIDRSRFEPHVASYRAEGMRYQELRSAGIPVLHLPVRSLKSPTAVTAAIRLRNYIREHDIQVVHAYDTSAVFAVSVARALRVPAVLSSTLGNRNLLDRRSHRLMRWTDRIVDTVVVNCEAMRRHLIDDEGVPGDRIELCYNGVVTNEFFPAEALRPEAISDASLVIGIVCVLRPEKALTLLQEAFTQVQQLHPNMKLLFVGSGPLLASLRGNAVRLEIAQNNVFIPATQDVATWLRSMDIFVLPSYSEAFSNSLLEAMACGCAVVGSRVGGTPELIGSNEERGLLFRNGDAGDLALKLSKLIADTEFRRSLGCRASDFVRENLTIEIAAARTGQIYEKLLQRKVGRQTKVSLATEKGLDVPVS